jgi:hypothetical protein
MTKVRSFGLAAVLALGAITVAVTGMAVMASPAEAI